MKSLIKLVIVVLLANALWRVSSAYMSFYRFRDALTDVAVHSKALTDEQLREKVIELAGAHDEPIAASAISIRRDERHTFIEGSYTKPVAVLPGYEYPWPFSLKVDGFVIVPVKLGDLANPQ